MNTSILKTLVENDALVRGLESLSGTKPINPRLLDEGTISQGSWLDFYPTLQALYQGGREALGIAPSERLMGRLNALRSPVLKPQTPFEWADWTAGTAAEGLQTGLAAADLAGLAGVASPMLKSGIKNMGEYAMKKKADEIGSLGTNIKANEYYRYHHNKEGYSDVPWMMFADDEESVMRGYGKHRFTADDSKAVDADDLYDDIVSALGKHKNLLDDLQATPEEIAQDLNPSRITESAGLWDNADIVQAIWDDVLEPKGILKVKTKNGLIVFDPSLVKKHNISGKTEDLLKE